MRFPRTLKGAVWHTTSHERYQMIIASGHILSTPPIPDVERWKTSAGPEYYPYTRIINGVSLFDFRDFRAADYSREYPLSDWDTFVPVRKDWNTSIWIQVDTVSLGSSFLSGHDLLAKWKDDKAYHHNIMPYIEAASLSPISKDHFLSVVQYSRGNPRLKRLDI